MASARPDTAQPPAKRLHISDAEIERALASRIFMQMSWSRWKQHREANNVPVLCNRITNLQHELLQQDGLPVFPFGSIRGAFVPFIALLVYVISSLLRAGLLSPAAQGQPLLVRVKVSSDQRSLRGNQNIGWFLSVLNNLDKLQDPWSQHTFALGDVKEKQLRGHILWEEMKLDDALAYILQSRLTIEDQVVEVNPFICGDWKNLSYIIGFAPANTPNFSAQMCGWCYTDKEYLWNGWLKGDPFTFWPVIWKRVALLPSLNSFQARYCAMHGCNRMLDNTLRLLTSIENRAQIEEKIHKVCPKWGVKSALRPVDTRSFYEHNIHQEIIALFVHSSARYTVPVPGGGQRRVSVHDFVASALNACYCFWKFAYTPQPREFLNAQLRSARNDILAFYYSLKSEVMPTMHYMTNHFLEFIDKDGSAYYFVQEGAEHHHKNDRDIARMIIPHDGGKYLPQGPMEQILNIQQLRRILINRGHNPN